MPIAYKVIELRSYELWEETVQQKILSKYSTINVDFDYWYEHTLDNLLGDMLTWDNVSFEYERYRYLEFNELQIKDEKGFYEKLGIPEEMQAYVVCSFYSQRGSRYHSTQIKLGLDEEAIEDAGLSSGFPKMEKQLEAAKEAFDVLLEDCLSAIREEYEFQTSENQVVDTLMANGYLFDENGKIQHV